MQYFKSVTLKNGAPCVIRNATAQDAAAVLSVFYRTHTETDYLASYPDEKTITIEQETEFLKTREEDEREVMLVAEVDQKIVGTAGINAVRNTEKYRHRASFGVGIEKDFWGLGIGSALVNACIECAKAATYSQLELEVVDTNERALALYQSAGFVEYGKNPLAFRSRTSGWQASVLMRMEL